MTEKRLSGVDKALWARRGRRIVAAVLVGAALLVVGAVAIRWWNQNQEKGLAQTTEKLDGVSASPPTPTATSVPPTLTPTLTPAPTPMPTPSSAMTMTPFIHIVASMGAVPEAPGPVVVPITLTVTRSDGEALSGALSRADGALSARLSGDGYLRLGVGKWYTDGTGMAWEMAAQVAVDSFQGSGVLTWTVMLDDGVLDMPLQWQVGQDGLGVDDVAPAK